MAWEPYAARLADDLVAAGKLTDPLLINAIRAVPRHELVPVFHRRSPTGHWVEHTSADHLSDVYANSVLITALGGEAVLSSSTQPGLMTRMLESLSLTDQARVLEIGTGTGYNAALLTHRLGDEQVFSIDVEPHLVDIARLRLARLGYQPTLAVGDGAGGLPAFAPYDAVIATCAVPAIPPAWIDQVRPGGVVVADLKPAPGAGGLVRLTRGAHHGAEGRFDRTYAAFMDLRSTPGTVSASFPVHRDHDRAERRTTRIDPRTPWTSLVVWFLASFDLGPEIALGHVVLAGSTVPTASWIATPDGSWAEVGLTDENGQHRVAEGGPRRLWRLVERAHHLWTGLGSPGWDRFGLTVTPAAQTVWFDSPDSGRTWDLRRV